MIGLIKFIAARIMGRMLNRFLLGFFLLFFGWSAVGAFDGLNSEELALTVDKVLIEKEARRLTLLWHGHIIHTYRVSLGQNPLGAKFIEGDNRTPEGFYVIDSRNPNSRYHLALHISYPNPKDLEKARKYDVPPGKDIMIHGLGDEMAWVGRLHCYLDWTEGCIAVTNEEIEEIWELVPDGTVVEITR